jgi:hypothetical protein
VRLRRIEIAVGDELAVEELRLPVVVALGVHGLHLGLGRERLGLDERRGGRCRRRPGALDLGLLVQNARARGIRQPWPGCLGLEDVRVDPRAMTCSFLTIELKSTFTP